MRVWIWIWSRCWCWGKVYTTFYCIHREREHHLLPKSGSVCNCCSFYYWFGFALPWWVCLYICTYICVCLDVCVCVFCCSCAANAFLCQQVGGSRKTCGCNSPFNQFLCLSHTHALAALSLVLSHSHSPSVYVHNQILFLFQLREPTLSAASVAVAVAVWFVSDLHMAKIVVIKCN